MHNCILWFFSILNFIFSLLYPHAYYFFLSIVPGPSRLSKVDAKLLKDGKPLSVPKDVEISVQEKCVVYTIKKPSRADTGKWTIKMSNAAGHSTKDVRINMQDKPSPPTSLEVSEIFSSHCTLSFAPPKDDGGMQLTYYTIEKQDFSLKGEESSNHINWYIDGLIYTLFVKL